MKCIQPETSPNESYILRLYVACEAITEHCDLGIRVKHHSSYCRRSLVVVDGVEQSKCIPAGEECAVRKKVPGMCKQQYKRLLTQRYEPITMEGQCLTTSPVCYLLVIEATGVHVGRQLVAGNSLSCFLRQLMGASCGKDVLKMYCHIWSGCCTNFIL